MTHSYSRLILSFALIALLAACGSNAQLSTSKVTITVSSGKNALSAPAISKAAPVISSLSLMIIVTAPDMDTITHDPISLASTPSGSDYFRNSNRAERKQPDLYRGIGRHFQRTGLLWELHC